VVAFAPEPGAWRPAGPPAGQSRIISTHLLPGWWRGKRDRPARMVLRGRGDGVAPVGPW
jgi:hypothetical protein